MVIGELFKALDYKYAQEQKYNSKFDDNSGIMAVLVVGFIAGTIYIAWKVLKFICYWIFRFFYFLFLLAFPKYNPLNKNEDIYIHKKSGRVYR